MNHTFQMGRRQTLRLLGAAPSMLLTTGAWSATPAPGQDPRLVVVMLRGAMDGLAAVPAVGDPAWGRWGRQADGEQAPLPLDGLFGLHPALKGLHGWYQNKQLLVVHAVASPYRERSHFDAQQVLESGGEKPFVLDTGWLARALQQPTTGGGKTAGALALTPAMPLALRGADQASTWTPDRRPVNDEGFLDRVSRLYQQDPLLEQAWASALAQQGMARELQMSGGHMAGGQTGGRLGGGSWADLAQQAGVFLSAPTGPRVAWIDVDGWDTHAQQAGRLQRQLSALDQGLLALQAALGAHWVQTTVVVVTEFGRTVALNGTGGTDHGTGGVALVAGGAVAGGRVVTDWPGLAPNQLLEGRDLRPTTDLRGLWAALAQRQWGWSQRVLSDKVLPGYTGRPMELWHA